MLYFFYLQLFSASPFGERIICPFPPPSISFQQTNEALTYSLVGCITFCFSGIPKFIQPFPLLVHTICKIFVIINRSVISIFVSYSFQYLCLHFYGIYFQQSNLNQEYVYFQLQVISINCFLKMCWNNVHFQLYMLSLIDCYQSDGYKWYLVVTYLCHFSDCEGGGEYFHVYWMYYLGFRLLGSVYS